MKIEQIYSCKLYSISAQAQAHFYKRTRRRGVDFEAQFQNLQHIMINERAYILRTITVTRSRCHFMLTSTSLRVAYGYFYDIAHESLAADGGDGGGWRPLMLVSLE